MDLKEFSPHFSVSLVNQVTEFLTDAIIEGRLTGGQRLSENELQRKFKISRGPIRESFRILEKNGLVETIPRKGTFVRKISKVDIEENFPVRALLEGFAGRLAVFHSKDEDIEGMRLALSKMIDAARKNDFKGYFNYHSEFHEILINASRNKTLIKILENLRRHAIWFRCLYLYFQESFQNDIRVHHEILDLLIEKNADRLEICIKDHIMNALDRFLRFSASNKQRNFENNLSELDGAAHKELLPDL